MISQMLISTLTQHIAYVCFEVEIKNTLVCKLLSFSCFDIDILIYNMLQAFLYFTNRRSHRGAEDAEPSDTEDFRAAVLAVCCRCFIRAAKIKRAGKMLRSYISTLK